MKRNLIVLAIAVLGFSGNAAIADPSLQMSAGEGFRLNAPEATSYLADTTAAVETGINQQDFVWNP